MKNNFLYWVAGMIFTLGLFAIYAFKPTNNIAVSYEYKQFSTIESIVPGGLGRSRILSTDLNGTLIENDLLNFYSLVGINFGNISNNDKIIVDKINEYSRNGWELYQVTTGSSANTSIGNTTGGIFITRYLFRKEK
jgi:hypothetical protein